MKTRADLQRMNRNEMIFAAVMSVGFSITLWLFGHYGFWWWMNVAMNTFWIFSFASKWFRIAKIEKGDYDYLLDSET